MSMSNREKPNEVLSALVSRYILGEDPDLKRTFTRDLLRENNSRSTILQALEKCSNYSMLDGEICECCGT